MYLTPACLVPWLIRRGLVDADAIIRGDLEILDSEHKSRYFHVLRREGPSYFVKQLLGLEYIDVAGLQREVAVCRTAESAPQFSSLHRLIPKLATYDSQRHTYAVEFLGHPTLHRYHKGIDDYPVEVGRLLGEALTVFHSPLGREFATRVDADLFPGEPPWLLSYHNTDYGTAGGAIAQLRELFLEDDEIPQLFDHLRSQWRLDGLVHRDLKWTNVLISDPETDPRLYIIDWETADRGDWCWDAGMALQGWWTFEAFAAADGTPTDAEGFLEATSELQETRAAVREFWSAWTSGVDLDTDDPQLTRKCVLFAAARMMQTAHEAVFSEPELTEAGLRIIQLSRYLLKHPETAIAWLS